MKYGNRSPKWKKVISSPFTIVILLVVVVVLIKAVSNIEDKEAHIDDKLASAQNEYQKLIEREATLRERVGFLSTEEGVEAELRAKYKAVADGEMVAVILEDKDNNASGTASSTVKLGWWKKMWSLIGL